MEINKTHVKTHITFIWDKDFIESTFKVKFDSEEEFFNWISDKSVEIIKESIESKKIWWMVKIDPINV